MEDSSRFKLNELTWWFLKMRHVPEADHTLNEDSSEQWTGEHVHKEGFGEIDVEDHQRQLFNKGFHRSSLHTFAHVAGQETIGQNEDSERRQQSADTDLEEHDPDQMSVDRWKAFPGDLHLRCHTMSRRSDIPQSDRTGNEHSQIRSAIPDQEESTNEGCVESSGRSANVRRCLSISQLNVVIDENMRVAESVEDQGKTDDETSHPFVAELTPFRRC